MNDKIEEIIFKEFQQWIYNDQNQSGDKLQVIDASDLPEIIKEVVKTLAMLPTFKITCKMETTKEVKTIQVDYECPKCEVGKLRPTGQKLLSNPPQYPHKCTECDFTETFRDKTYPYIIIYE